MKIGSKHLKTLKTRVKPVALASVAIILSACGSMGGSGGGWTSLVDGTKGLDNFNRVGEANWVALMV